MTKQRFLGVYRLFFMALALVAVVTTLSLSLRGENFSAVNFFSFFTIEGNLLAAFSFLLTGAAALRAPERPTRFATLRGFSALALTLTGIIYFLLLRGLEESLQIPLPWVNTVLHYIMPLAVLADWLLDPPHQVITFRRSLVWILFPVAYVVYSLLRGPFADWYPYPFLNASVQSYSSIALTCAVMLVLVIVLAALLAARTRVGRRASI